MSYIILELTYGFLHVVTWRVQNAIQLLSFQHTESLLQSVFPLIILAFACLYLFKITVAGNRDNLF